MPRTRTFEAKDEPRLRRELAHYQANRQTYAEAVKDAQKKLTEAQAAYQVAAQRAAETHAILKYGLGCNDVVL